MNSIDSVETLRWIGDRNGFMRCIDQTRLPRELVEIDCRDVATVWSAIRQLQVRGAPAIGIAAAYGLCLAVQSCGDESDFFQKLYAARDYLAGSRPTAVNLGWALNRLVGLVESMRAESTRGQHGVDDIRQAMWCEAMRIHEEDRVMCRAIGAWGEPLLVDGSGVLTHCNAGGLATSGYGTALAVIFTAWERGKSLHVYVDETRPLLQGARLTAWELQHRQIPATLLCDSMAAQVMREGRVQAVIVGADRIAANGDTANKIGTYGLAVLASAHRIPFFVAAPSSTFDLSIASGDEIPIEQRDAEEVTRGFGTATAPEGIAVYNPAFDVTPARYIRAIITECGVIDPVDSGTIRKVLSDSQRPSSR
ncbi:MAG: Methylthioribose-phosphate isomerase [Planctomycetota bacterium]